MFTTYEETLHYLYGNVPVFQRVGSSAYKPDLTNTLKLCALVGNPQTKFKSIHVAGTNGKGSSSHMLASVLQSAGYKTGLYTSPHLKNFTERIRINGEEVSPSFVVDFINRIREGIESIRPSFFEITVAMAFDYFALRQIDVAVIEVGLGGRLDSTNIIRPEVCLITNIGLDHTDLLGDTLPAIAAEKAGIIKPFVPVVISERQPAVEEVFIEKARAEQAPIIFAADEVHVTEAFDSNNGIVFTAVEKDTVLFEKLPLPLQGIYQRNNLGGVIKTVSVLRDAGFSIDHAAVIKGLHNVIVNTKLKGRWQKLGEAPLIICDTGHNVDGMTAVVQQIKLQRYTTLHIVMGMVKDKDIRKVLALLPKDAQYYFCQATIPRALEATLLADQAKEFGLNGMVISDVNDAIEEARRRATKEDFIFIGGSTFVVAEIENL